jgi:hypothetical protein
MPPEISTENLITTLQKARIGYGVAAGRGRQQGEGASRRTRVLRWSRICARSGRSWSNWNMARAAGCGAPHVRWTVTPTTIRGARARASIPTGVMLGIAIGLALGSRRD